MANLSRIVITWSGAGVVGGGVSIFHCTPGGEHAFMTAYRTYLLAVAGSFPTSVTWSFPSSGSIVDEVNDELVDAWSDGSPPAAVSGTSANTWANGVGARVKWTTGAFHAGHRVTGATFMVPLQINAYEGSGNILDSYVTVFRAAALDLVASTNFKVYSRPRPGVPGQGFVVNGADFPDKVSWLRGRRT